MIYYGDFAEDDTVNMVFNTFSSDDPSASVTITNLADADVKVHKDLGLTQIATDGATVSIDFDSITGNHAITIDTSAHADYSTGSEYQVRVEGTTVDGATINAWIGCFSIERAGGVLALLKAGNISANVEQISGDATAADNAESFFDGTGYAGTNNVIPTVTTTTNLTNLPTIPANWLTASGTAADFTTEIQAGLATASALSTVDGNVDAIKAVTDVLPDSGALTSLATASALATVDGNVDAILLDTAEIGAAGAGLTALATQASVNTIDSNVDAILVDTGTDIPARFDGIEGATFNTATDSLEALRNQGDASWITADVSSLATAANLATVAGYIDTEVAAILEDTGTTLPAQLDSISGATFDSATDSLEALRNRGDAAWTTGAGGSPPQLLQSTTIATLASQTSFTLTAGSPDDDAYNTCIIVIVDQSTATQKAIGTISDYVGSTKTVTLSSDPAIFTIATGDTVNIMAPLGTGSTSSRGGIST